MQMTFFSSSQSIFFTKKWKSGKKNILNVVKCCSREFLCCAQADVEKFVSFSFFHFLVVVVLLLMTFVSVSTNSDEKWKWKEENENRNIVHKKQVIEWTMENYKDSTKNQQQQQKHHANSLNLFYRNMLNN